VAELEFRAATPEDRTAVLGLLGASLGWGGDERFARFFAWKHDRNPFGASPALVAVDGDRIVGLRTFLRWEFLDAGGARHRAVRAVDTATDPEYQGRGIFRALTMRALDELAADGVAFVFNTPNTQSRPGYLRMGWVEVGRLPATVRFRSAGSALRALRARVPAERWSQESRAGRPAAEVLAGPELADLVDAAPGPGPGLRTNRTPAYLRWRYEFPDLGYRALTVSSRLADGLGVFRVRRRGGAVECALCEMLVPDGAPGARRELLRAVAREAGSDYVIRIGGGPVDSGFVRLPRQGPVLTWRPLAPGVPGATLDAWRLGLGDVELF
jgi:GNAT superfamily N-acetyltransferase